MSSANGVHCSVSIVTNVQNAVSGPRNDGLSPVSVLVRLVGTDPAEALVVLCDLYARGLVAFD